MGKNRGIMEITKPVSEISLEGEILENLCSFEVYEELKKICSKKIESTLDRKWIEFEYAGEKGYFNREFEIAIPIREAYGDSTGKCFGRNVILLEPSEIEKLLDKTIPKKIESGILAGRCHCGNHYVETTSCYPYCYENGVFGYEWVLRCHLDLVKFTKDEFIPKVFDLQIQILDAPDVNNAIALLNKRGICELSREEIDQVVEILQIDRKKVETDIKNKLQNKYTLNREQFDYYTESLLKCDTYRAELEKYDKKCLEDVNSGHWELWEDADKKGAVNVKIENKLIARNPEADIHEDGLIGIDFGTKSTIVSKRDGNNKTNLMRIGIGQLNKVAEAHHYENPTIMEFVNLEKFRKDYVGSSGRPKTSINDITVSHKANNSLKDCSESDFFYSYFYDIKQWCGDTKRKVKIIDQNKVEKLLPSFIDLDENEFNPLEVYAYYLGLYINNMRNGIFLDYILSFPVTYEKAVKEKILDSFTKGLKKSLPESILKNNEIMSKFRVKQGVSEPAAYAITALQEYGFEPDEDEKVFYAIFDFGGGTTDFDFGVWRGAKDTRAEARYDYVIEHFGSEGDKYLGGENLLELLAYEVFKANASRLQTGAKLDGQETGKKGKQVGFSFSKPKEGEDFVGSETLIANSQEAKRNTKQLMEVLRDFWEGIVDIDNNSQNSKASAPKKTKAVNTGEQVEKNLKNKSENNTKEDDTISYNGYKFKNNEIMKKITNGELVVDLFDKDGNRQAAQKLYIHNPKENIDVNLVEILEKRIDMGVQHFFSSIRGAFKNNTAKNSGVDDIKIFLAGNSSKSPILKKCFNKYIENENKEINKTKGAEGEHFYLYPPLGTEEAKQKQKELKVEVKEELDAPTGKTGVAYGLIAGRSSGKIKVISEISSDEETKFRYNLGKEKRNKFQEIINRNAVEYGKWEWFIDASDDFEIYYTTLPSASKMLVNDIGIYNKSCKLSVTDENADIYIRAVSPDELEYAVSKNGVPGKNAECIRIKLEI